MTSNIPPNSAITNSIYNQYATFQEDEESHDGIIEMHQDVEEEPPVTKGPRRGSLLWRETQRRLDTIILRSGMNAKEFDDAMNSGTKWGEVERRQRLKQEKNEEIQHAMEFSVCNCILAIMLYLAVSVVAYSFILENWSIIDSLYFSIVTFSTVGYGDLTPTNDLSRLFTALYALIGVSCLGIALGILGSNLMESEARAKELAKHMSRGHVMTLFSAEDSDHVTHHKATNETTIDSKRSSCRRELAKFLIPTFVLMCGAFVFVLEMEKDNDKWTVPSTLYYLIITATTIGYGDQSPHSQMGRLFSVFYIPLAVMTMGEFLRVVANAIIDYRQKPFRESLRTKEFTLRDFEAMDDDGDGKITRAGYLEFMLLAMHKVDRELLLGLNQQFDRLDADGDGQLDIKDLILTAKQRLHSTQRKLELAAYKEELMHLAQHADR